VFWKKNKEFRLQVGDHVIGINTHFAEYAESMEEYFGIKSAAGKPDLSINLIIVEHEEDMLIHDSMFIHKKTEGVNFIFGNDLAYGNFSNERMRGDLYVKRGMTQIPVSRVFEQILYQAFYSIIKKRESRDFLIHSSGVIYKGKAFLFIGSSGSGKSTVAKLSDEYIVLNDEICLVKNTCNGYYLESTPFNGLFHRKKTGCASLAAVFLIAHGLDNRIKNINKSDAVKKIAKEIVPPIGLTDKLSADSYADMLDYSSDMFDNVPVKVLEFLPDKRFWEIIEMEYFKYGSQVNIC